MEDERHSSPHPSPPSEKSGPQPRERERERETSAATEGGGNKMGEEAPTPPEVKVRDRGSSTSPPVSSGKAGNKTDDLEGGDLEKARDQHQGSKHNRGGGGGGGGGGSSSGGDGSDGASEGPRHVGRKRCSVTRFEPSMDPDRNRLGHHRPERHERQAAVLATKRLAASAPIRRASRGRGFWTK